jgi:hypothetical protein
VSVARGWAASATISAQSGGLVIETTLRSLWS